MRMLRFLKSRLPCSWQRGISSSHVLTNRTYFKSWPGRWSHTCSPKRQASSAPGSGVWGRLLAHSSIGPVLQGYAKIQAQRPYTTQICTSIVIWLCGDLSAQLFPSEPIDGNLDKSQDLQRWDPWRTARHLTVGIMASVPSYECRFYQGHRLNKPSRAYNSPSQQVL
ncbi:hypothetical protein PENSUB_10457 [Penicillium subrubescens]|uniref:Uncharacterized protein n=1 Tax=Penicillium subrubescens TaxID=1316194 RepID=A0A1Q5T9L4_9EURO|nr:hypothetical protein PENSUB_10457 [Penicillium subrubescens]